MWSLTSKVKFQITPTPILLNMQKLTFARKASGLARPVTVFDVVSISFQTTAIGFIAMNLSYGYAIKPGGDWTLATLLGGVLTLCAVLSYAMCASVLPRSGGDYVYVSRVLHPALGNVAAMNNMVFQMFWFAWNSIQLVLFGGPLILGELWAATGNGGYLDKIAWISANAQFVGLIGGLGSVLIYAILVIPAFRVWINFARVWFILCLVGGFLVILILALTPPAKFSANLTALVGKSTIDATISKGISQGAIQPFSWNQTFALFPLVFSGCGWTFSSVYVAGEYRDIKKSTLFAIPASLMLALVLQVGWHLSSLYAVGSNFLFSSNALFNLNPGQYTLAVSPNAYTFAGIASGNLLLSLVIGISFLSSFVVPGPWNLIVCSRYAFAMAMDRVLPSRLTNTNRYGSPHYAVGAFIIIGVVWVILYLFTPVANYLGLTGILGLSIAYFLTQVSTVVLPFRMKDAFEASAVKWRVGKIPVMSIVGAIGTIFVGWMIALFVMDPLYGANSPTALSIVVAVPVAALVAYFAIRAYRKRQGIDIELLYKEIPPV